MLFWLIHSNERELLHTRRHKPQNTPTEVTDTYRLSRVVHRAYTHACFHCLSRVVHRAYMHACFHCLTSSMAANATV